jgi:hypothetical protein
MEPLNLPPLGEVSAKRTKGAQGRWGRDVAQGPARSCTSAPSTALQAVPLPQEGRI